MIIITGCKYCNRDIMLTQYDEAVNLDKYGTKHICSDCKRKIDSMTKNQKRVFKI